jgi:hypothetical protein
MDRRSVGSLIHFIKPGEQFQENPVDFLCVHWPPITATPGNQS